VFVFLWQFLLLLLLLWLCCKQIVAVTFEKKNHDNGLQNDCLIPCHKEGTDGAAKNLEIEKKIERPY
jgi:hypothetical protein